MLDLNTLKKYDVQKMYQTYDRWPEIANESFDQNFNEIQYSDVDHIIFAGMGGSGALGDIFTSILSKSDMHVKVVKGYLLPKTVDSNTLVIATSVSGNTNETLTVLKSAQKIDCKIIAFSSGGKMEQYCNNNNIEYRKIQIHHSPRSSFTSYLYSMLRCLSSIIPVKDTDIKESIRKLEDMKKNISSENMTENNEALSLASWIKDTPLIYYPFGLQAAAIRFKNSLQENAKTHAMAEDVVEACHNSIVAWENKTSIQPILIEGEDDYIRTKERWKILKDYFKMSDIDYTEVHSIEGSILSKIINLIYLLDYSSIYLSAKKHINPSPVRSIDFVKNYK